MYFWTDRLRQTWLDKYLKSPISENPSNSNMVTRPKHLKSERRQLYHIYCLVWLQFSWKNSVLVICKILRLFVNPLTADDKYCLFNRGNLLQHIQMHLSQKWKIFSQFFLHFPNLDSILNIFLKMDDLYS